MDDTSASSDKQPWSFDVSSLMVLINENEELNYRLSQRSFLECISAVPVVGLQSYIRSYNLLFEAGTLSYFSPYGCKSAPLRNIQLTNAVKHQKLLEDRKYTVYTIRDKAGDGKEDSTPETRKYQIRLAIWTFTTWILFGALIVLTRLVPNTTWVGVANCTVFTGWSILLRIVEFYNIEPAPAARTNITAPDDPDAIFIMGRDNSAFVLEGKRKYIKDWTSRGLCYKAISLGVSADIWQGMTRLASLLVLLFIFSTIPNGSTIDQVAFIILNLLAQLNVIVGQRLRSGFCLAHLKILVDEKVDTRTHVYGELLRRFKKIEETNKWVKASGLIPQTDVWNEWETSILNGDTRDAKVLYNDIANRPSSLL